MRINNIKPLLIIVSLCALSFSVHAEISTASATVDHFYKNYLNDQTGKTPRIRPSYLAMSQSFSRATKKNAALCAAYSTGVCGWDAGGDVFLDTQEVDPALNYDNSSIKITEIKPNTVQVSLNVYPSSKDAGDYYKKTITYKMVKEKGQYVMDDMVLSDGTSMRKKIAIENANVLAHPDPDSPMGKQRAQTKPRSSAKK